MRDRLLRNILSLLFTVGSLILPLQSADAQVSCQDLFKSSGTYGSLKRDFKHNSNYSNELSEQTAIKNQCQLGTCHLHSWASAIEKSHLKRTGEQIEVSMPYLAAVHWLDQAIGAVNAKYVRSQSAGFDVKLGANVSQSRMIIRKHGIVPEGVWAPKMHFDRAPVAGRLEEAVVNRIAKAKWDLEREINPRRQHEIRERTELDLNDLFSAMAGELPESFNYRGKTYTPQEFAREKFPEIFEPQVMLYVNDGRKDPTFRRKKQGDTLIDTNIDKVEELARKAIDAGESVYLSYEHNGNYVDKKTAIMSISAFNLPKNSGPMSREQRAYFKVKSGGHAVQIIGYDTDPKTNRVVKWKIQNSWGDQAGDQGIFHMYSDYFRAFTKGVSFRAAAQIDLPANEAKTEGQISLPF